MRLLQDNSLLIVCGLVLTLLAGSTSMRGAHKDGRTRPSSEREAPARVQEGRSPGTESEQINEMLARALGLEHPPKTLAQIRKHAGVHFIIATVPHPERGGLAVFTDEVLDAISSSAVDAGLLLDVHRVPWKSPKAAQANGTEPKRAPDPAHEQHSAERFGALVFRDRESTNLLVVLLVGESAVEGVDAESLRVALEIAGCEEGQQLILGPSFSGSARKMWHVINDSEANCSARILSGSATGDLHEESLDPAHKLGRTMVPDAVLFDFLKDALRESNPNARLAVLSESGTGYAATFRTLRGSNVRDSGLNPPVCIGPPESSTAGLPSSASSHGERDRQELEPSLRVRSYTFPLHVADLRFAHGRNSKALDERLAPLHRSLDIDLGSTQGQNDDDLVVYSPLTPLSVESTLRSTFSAIARWSADYLMIVATDPADLLFLAEEARAYAPSTQLVTVSANALFEHASVSSTLQGALVASSYPLGLDNQSWSRFCYPDSPACDAAHARGADRFKSFASDGAQGVYNAMHWLIREAIPRADPTPQPDRLSPISEKLGSRPWLSLIDGRAWPLRFGAPVPSCTDDRCIDVDHHSNGYRQPQPVSRTTIDQGRGTPFVRPTRFAVGWGIVVFAACLLQVMVFLVARFRGNMIESPLVRAFDRVQAGAPRAAVQYQATAHLALGLYGLALSIGALHTYSLSWMFARPGAVSWEDRTTAIVLAVGLPTVSVALLALALWTPTEWLWHRYVRPDGRDAASRSSAAATACRHYVSGVQSAVSGLIVLSVAFVVASLVYLDQELGSPKAALLLVRLSDPLGPCPLGLLFFLAAGMYTWAILGLSRADAIARFTRNPPLSRVPFSPGTRLSDSGEEGVIWRSALWELALVLSLFGPIVLLNDRLQPTFEWQLFDSTIKLLMLLLVAGVLFACLQATLFWSRLRRILEDHAGTPLIEAYSRIASKVTASFGTQLRSHVPPPRELRVSVQNLELLYHLASKLKQDNPIAGYIEAIKPTLGNLLNQLKHAYAQDGNLEHPTAALERAAHDAFFAASAKLYEILENIWRLRVEHPSPPDAYDVPTDALLPAGRLSGVPTGFIFAASMPPDCLLWVRVAEDFVAMRFVSWTYHVLAQIRWLITFAIIGAVMLLCAVFAYPLQPHRFIVLFTGSILVVAAGSAFRIIVHMQSNEILRRLAPGAGFGGLKLDLAKQVLTYVVLPVVLLAARIFPEFGESMSKVLDPLFSILQ